MPFVELYLLDIIFVIFVLLLPYSIYNNEILFEKERLYLKSVREHLDRDLSDLKIEREKLERDRLELEEVRVLLNKDYENMEREKNILLRKMTKNQNQCDISMWTDEEDWSDKDSFDSDDYSSYPSIAN